MFQIFEKDCAKCSTGHWVSISDGELSALIDGGKKLTSLTVDHGVLGLSHWVEELEKELESGNGVIDTQYGLRLIRII